VPERHLFRLEFLVRDATQYESYRRRGMTKLQTKSRSRNDRHSRVERACNAGAVSQERSSIMEKPHASSFALCFALALICGLSIVPAPTMAAGSRFSFTHRVPNGRSGQKKSWSKRVPRTFPPPMTSFLSR
jgi:hypothetical protein